MPPSESDQKQIARNFPRTFNESGYIEKIIYSKTLPWQHEGEYRLAIPLRKGEPPWNTLKYHPEEITELYLGLAMAKEDKEEIVSKAKALNSAIAIFQTERDANTKLTFNRI